MDTVLIILSKYKSKMYQNCDFKVTLYLWHTIRNMHLYTKMKYNEQINLNGFSG